ncbi:MAG: protein YgfX [Pseudomonadota bacterium]|nr:protein YgfX [Pseudomonadota bacterium]MDP1904014.1 protein YgfX [Pseudomonadota bacterium]MDP2352086.1 protein YgfX [Pseudomonadota bacterium]
MFPSPLLLDTHASRVARRLALALHLAALAALLLARLPPIVWAAGLALLAMSLTLSTRRPDLPRLRCKSDGRLEIWRDGSWRAAQLLPDSVALPWLIVLRWRENGRRHRLLLPPDALRGDEHRRLRVWLRWKADVVAP